MRYDVRVGVRTTEVIFESNRGGSLLVAFASFITTTPFPQSGLPSALAVLQKQTAQNQSSWKINADDKKYRYTNALGATYRWNRGRPYCRPRVEKYGARSLSAARNPGVQVRAFDSEWQSRAIRKNALGDGNGGK